MRTILHSAKWAVHSGSICIGTSASRLFSSKCFICIGGRCGMWKNSRRIARYRSRGKSLQFMGEMIIYSPAGWRPVRWNSALCGARLFYWLTFSRVAFWHFFSSVLPAAWSARLPFQYLLSLSIIPTAAFHTYQHIMLLIVEHEAFHTFLGAINF